MLQLSNYNLMKSVNSTAFLKKITYIFLIWACLTYNDAGIFLRSFEEEYNVEVTSVVGLRRSLAKLNEHKVLQNRRTNVYLSSNGINKNINNDINDIQAYKHIKKEALNDLDNYRKGFKHRYSKKKGLAKLDCYCENKLFQQIDYVDNLSKKMKNKKNAFIKKILSKYGLHFILFVLSPMLGIIFPILFGGPKREQLIPHCWGPIHPGYIKKGSKEKCTATLFINRDTLNSIYVFNCVLFYILLIIVVLTILYTFKKIIKYERLKSGKGKMKGKEYFNFCKEVFRIM